MAAREQKRWQYYQKEKTEPQARKKPRKNRKPGRVRERAWTDTYDQDPDGYNTLDLPMMERVMPPGEKERRRTPASAAADPGPPVSTPAPPSRSAVAQQGIVVEVSSGLCRVDLGENTLLCTLRGGLSAMETGYTNLVAVGDEVLVEPAGPGQGIVETVLPRRRVLTRPDTFQGHSLQVIVANVDQLLIVASWREPALWPELIDRYLIAAQRQNLRPIICVNKVDLAAQPGEPEEELAPYTKLGYVVLLTSAETGIGLETLSAMLQGKTTALAGLSGVGKSSLLNKAEPGLTLRIGVTSERRHEGRHTTTQASLHRLARGGFVVDTPGIREFGLSGIRRRDLVGFYPEIAAAMEECRFAKNCTHMNEPGCAVKLAVRSGEISATRFENYGKILRDLPE